MTDSAEYARGVANRGTNSKGASSSAGNPGTYLRTETIDGVTYARYRAEQGTWVSASLKQLGYDQQYGKDVAFGAYAGVVRTPDGKTLPSPDRIRPGQEYLIPISTGDQASRISNVPGPLNSRAVPGQPRPEKPSSALNLPSDRSDVTLPEAQARHRIIGDRATGTDTRVARKKKVDDSREWQDQLIARVLRRLIASGTLTASNGRDLQQDQIQKVRGRVGLVSDWLNDVQPPYIGAWSNANNFFVLASERLSSGDLPEAMSDVVTGYSQLFQTQRDWNQYLETSILGASETIKQLRATRDTAVAVEVALATGDIAAPAIGGIGGGLVGGGVGIGTLSESESPAGEAVRGTIDEIKRAGLMSNLRLAREGLIGIAYGIGESLNEIPGALVQLPKSAMRLLDQAGDILVTLFKDPTKVYRDFARLPEVVAMLYQALSNRWEWLKSLPPDKQAFEIGRLSGHIEAALMVLKAGPPAGAAAGDLSTDLLSTIPSGTDVAVLQLVNLQAQLQVVEGSAAGVITSVAMAAGPKGGLGGGSSGDKPTQKPVRKPQAGDSIWYGDKARTKGLDRHEVLQHLWLRVNDIIGGRKKGLGSRANPTLLLPPDVHRVVGRYQQALGLNRENVAEWAKLPDRGIKKVLSLNAVAMKQAGVPQSTISKVLMEALEHAIFSLARGD